jgi:hypothetical protein
MERGWETWPTERRERPAAVAQSDPCSTRQDDSTRPTRLRRGSLSKRSTGQSSASPMSIVGIWDMALSLQLGNRMKPHLQTLRPQSQFE